MLLFSRESLRWWAATRADTGVPERMERVRVTPGVLPAAADDDDDDDGVDARGGTRDGEDDGVVLGVDSRPASRGFLATADMTVCLDAVC